MSNTFETDLPLKLISQTQQVVSLKQASGAAPFPIYAFSKFPWQTRESEWGRERPIGSDFILFFDTIGFETYIWVS